jgi:hypothetical protein
MTSHGFMLPPFVSQNDVQESPKTKATGDEEYPIQYGHVTSI